LKSVFFLNDSIGYVAGDSGLIIKTINGGNTWNQQTTGTISSFSKIFFVNDSIGFALAGQTLYKTNKNSSLGIFEFIPFNNHNFVIYPNPFSTQTTLQTDKIFKDATLTIYNSFGNVVKQLKNISGQTVNLQRENLPSGLYFLRLAEGNDFFSEGKLLITDNPR
jgi:hypothetical protein